MLEVKLHDICGCGPGHAFFDNHRHAGFHLEKNVWGGGGGGGGGGVVASAVQNVLRLINSPEEVWPTAVSES